MPIYEYVCRECRQHFERIVQGSTPPTCPGCGSPDLDRQLSVFAVGAKSRPSASRPSTAPCGTCGDPRGPGSCALN